jgi:hypothetical protein
MERTSVEIAKDRGSADAYYGRRFNPHILVPNDHGGRVQQPVEKGTPEYAAYEDGYVNETDQKDWG